MTTNFEALQAHLEDPLLFSSAVAKILDALAAGAALAPASMFQSTIRTATGSAENIAHGMASAPRAVLVSVYDSTAGSGVFVMTEGAQTLNGVKTFSSGIPITATTNQLILGTTNTSTITAPAPAASPEKATTTEPTPTKPAPALSP